MLSEDNKVLPMAKHIELLTRFVPFDMNQKNLITKMTTRMQNIAVDEGHYLETREMLGKWEQYLMKLSLDMVGAFGFSKISIETLIKAAGICVEDDYDNLGEQLLDYFELVQEYDGKKIIYSGKFAELSFRCRDEFISAEYSRKRYTDIDTGKQRTSNS